MSHSLLSALVFFFTNKLEAMLKNNLVNPTQDLRGKQRQIVSESLQRIIRFVKHRTVAKHQPQCLVVICYIQEFVVIPIAGKP